MQMKSGLKVRVSVDAIACWIIAAIFLAVIPMIYFFGN